MRVTQNMLDRCVIFSMEQNLERLAKLTEQLSTGRKVNTASDDVAATGRILQLQGENGRLSTYLDNISWAKNTLNTATDALQQASEIITSIKELGIQAATGTYSDADRAAMAEGVDGLLRNLITLVNTKANGAYLFSGEATDTSSYALTTDASGNVLAVTYQGAVVSTEVSLGASTNLEVNLVGKTMFEGEGDLFETVIRLRDAIRDNDLDEINSVRGDLDTCHDDVRLSLGRLGERLDQMDALRTVFERFKERNDQLISDNQDADIGEVTVEYNSQMALLLMTMKVAAQLVKPSLLNFT